ncbi:MAG: phosphoglycerate dehydrogenase [Chloroflexi bacterium]|nr:phosphoglycerate dehydrogenase [Chloroflexota bacterium]
MTHRDVNHKLLVAEPLGKEGLELLQQHVHVDVRLKSSRDELTARLPDYHALIVRSATQVNEQLLDAGKNLIVVGRAGVGVDNIDVEAATKRGITVVNAPTTNIVAAAEHALAILWALARKIPQADASVRRGEWKREQFIGAELVGKRLGLVGFGRVGGEVARRAVGLGLDVAAFDPYVTPERAAQMQVKMVSFDELLATSDFVSLHTPVTAETKKLIGAAELAKCKPGARLVNTARGALLDENALLDALDTGHLAGAALDVFDKEPPHNERLLKHPAVVLTPHIGGSTTEAATRVSLEVAGEVLAVLQGKPARFAVNAPLVSPTLAPVLHPYINLAERLGRFYTKWVGGPLGKIEIEYAGTIASEETGVLTAAVIKGLLGPIVDTRVNLVNAALLAQAHGLHVAERKTRDVNRYDNLLTLTGERRVSGIVLHDEPHIVQLDGNWVDFVPKGYVMLTRHRDRPGMIGRVGTLLGAADVNIASMQVAREAPRGEAIMVLTLDDPAPDSVMQAICRELDIQWSQVLDL